MGDVLVRGRGLTRFYRSGHETVAGLRAASFEVSDGDLIALSGPSGSGKSTLLHLVAGTDEPTAGSIEWPSLGQRASLRPRWVGMAFQGPSLMPPLTAAENVALPGLLLGWSESRAADAARTALERFDAGALGPRLPEELSGGQMQRVAMARAVLAEPRLLLADEPTGQQDAVTGALVMDALLEWAKEHGAVLLVATHDQRVAERFSTLWRLHDGLLETEVMACSA